MAAIPDEQTGGASDAIPLEPNCVWVLRLPYIYTDEVKVYHQPKVNSVIRPNG
jgi:hypothetical protein